MSPFAAPQYWSVPDPVSPHHAGAGTRREDGSVAQVDLAACLTQLEVVGNLSTDAILVYDEDERIIFANRSSADVMGAADPSDILGRQMADFVPEDEVPRVEARRRTIQAGMCPDPGEFGVVGLDGLRRTMRVSSARVRIGGSGARIVVARDVTAFKESERSRGRLEEQLAVARRLESLGRLAGGVAHDFNNLLTVITGYTELALGEVHPKSPLEQSLLRIDEAAERAAGLTGQLLAFGRRQVLRPQTLDLNGVVESMQPMLSRLIGEDISLVLRLSPERCPVQADRGQVEQVIMNLVINGRDAMPTGGEIVVGTAIDPAHAQGAGTETSRCHAVLMVSDQGPGMDEETVDRIFEPFFTTKPQGTGTGLGLSTVYGIVKQSGGGIHVESRLGVGTTFRIWLPRAEERDLPAGTGAEEDGRSAPSGVGKTILLVEDDRAIRELAQKILVKAGFKVVAAANAEEALGVLADASPRFDLLITDVILPGMDGATLAEAVKQDNPGIRVLFMSGYTAERIGSKGVVRTGVELLEKPFTPRALVRRARDILDRP